MSKETPLPSQKKTINTGIDYLVLVVRLKNLLLPPPPPPNFFFNLVHAELICLFQYR